MLKQKFKFGRIIEINNEIQSTIYFSAMRPKISIVFCYICPTLYVARHFWQKLRIVSRIETNKLRVFLTTFETSVIFKATGAIVKINKSIKPNHNKQI